MAKKIKRSSLIVGALLIYTTIVAFYFFVYLGRENSLEEYLTIGFSYVIILILGLVLRKKERLKAEREREINKQNLKQTK